MDMQDFIPSLDASLELLANRWNVASLSLFYKYYFGRCSSELPQVGLNHKIFEWTKPVMIDLFLVRLLLLYVCIRSVDFRLKLSLEGSYSEKVMLLEFLRKDVLDDFINPNFMTDVMIKT